MLDILNEISELIYVTDIETHELLFINKAGKKTFGIDDFHGAKCYKALQGFDSPCPFCNSDKLTKNEIFTRDMTSPVSGNHYLLRDKLIGWNGKIARLEMAVDITEKENEKNELKSALDSEKVIMQCVKLLYQAHDIDSAIQKVLSLLGKFLGAERTYIYEIDGTHINNTFEWCARGITPNMSRMQEMDIRQIDRWLPIFQRHECVVLEKPEQLRKKNPAMYNKLRESKTRSFVTAPIEKNGQLVGFMGVDNPPEKNLKNISPLLHTLRYFLMSTTRHAEEEQLLSKLSYFDTLTGFCNRNCFTEDIIALEKHRGTVGAVYLDVNGLKDSNDRYGHEYGDEVLVGCAKNIEVAFGNEELYRIGGDEFVVICRDMGKAEFEEGVNHLKQRFKSTPKYSASIGYKWAKTPVNISELISEADTQMYEEKKKFYRNSVGSKRYRHFNDDILGLTNAGELEKSLANNQFIVYFQPKISFNNRAMVGAEALVRFVMPSGTILAPSKFLPLLEEAKLISAVDFFVFEYCCKKQTSWSKSGKKIVPISTNFSRHSLLERDFVQRVCAICEQYGVDKKWVELEVTESVEGPDSFDAKKLIRELRSAGFAVSIDDFGAHFANLSLFTSIDFDVLKLDKSIIDDVVTNEKARSVIESLTSICKKTNVATIAEGVETEEQFEQLRRIGCDIAQGYLFSKPICTDEFEAAFLA